MKRASALILCLAILLALALTAGAEQQGKSLYPLARVDDSALYLAAQPTQEGTFSVTVNGQSFEACRVTTVEQAQLPVTYYCIVDQSSSFSNAQKQHERRALTALSDSMRSIDSMVLVHMGESISFGDPLTTPEERKAGIETACKYSAKFTNLNDSIVTAVETVSRIQDENSLSCIILLTDGLDNARVEVSQEQVRQTIEDSRLSFNVVSLVDPWAEQFAKNNAARVGLYAEASLGGVAKTPSQDYDSPTCVEDDMAEIMAQVLSSSVIALDVTALPRTESALNIGVTQGRSTDSRSVDTARLPSPPAPTQPETTEATEVTHPETTEATQAAQPETTEVTRPETTEAAQVETTEAAQPEATEAAQVETTEAAQPETTGATQPETRAPSHSGSSSANLIVTFVLAGVVVLVILLVLAVLLWRKQRNLEQTEEEDEFSPEDSLLTPAGASPAEEKLDAPSLAELKKRLNFEKGAPQEEAMPDLKLNIPTRQPDSTPGCRVRLVPEDHPTGALEFTIGINESVTLGRNQRSDIILSETDRALSSLHFELQWDSRVLHLRDRKSTNGTALNSVPLRPEVWVRVENKSVIQAGSTRYTVFVEKK